MPTPPEITITINVEQLNAMMALLGTHPYNQVADLLMLIRQQATAQIQQMQTARPNGESRVAPA